MPLKVAAGQYSSAGRKPANQDFHGLCVPREPQLATKGVAIAIADGISSSEAAQAASQAAVTTFLEDYYCTSEAWSVRKSAERVLAAVNSWLYAQTQQGQGRYDKDRGWACTFSALVLKARTAHVFHAGDTRVYQVQGKALEPLTQDHRVAIGGGQSYLGRAFGIGSRVDIDYRTVPLAEGDTFVLATDGVYEHVREREMLDAIAAHPDDLDAAARAIADTALAAGSTDNVTVQLLRIDALPPAEAGEFSRLAAELPPAPILSPRMDFDGYRIVRELHGSSRSHIYLATDLQTQATVVLKTPSTDLQADPAAVERFLLEEWIARRVDSPHVLKAAAPTRPRNFLYVVMEYVEGRTLAQWRVDHPRPALDAVRGLVEQVARGLRALHRLEMVHLDLRPENVMIDGTGTARLIDFGATQVAGLAEMDEAHAREPRLGMVQSMAPEVLLGERPTAAADQFSLAVMAYQMLTGRLPYGIALAQCRTPADLKRLRYAPVGEVRRDIPDWVDGALQKALQPQPARRYADVSEFVFALHQPDPSVRARRKPPLIERDPVVFWKGVSLLLALACLFLLARAILRA